jgi:hypothetical protein
MQVEVAAAALCHDTRAGRTCGFMGRRPRREAWRKHQSALRSESVHTALLWMQIAGNPSVKW